jgi:hypothetical protein
VVGGYLAGRSAAPLHDLATASEPLRRRTAITAPPYFVHAGSGDDLAKGFEIAARLAGDPDPRISKPVGIFLRHGSMRDSAAQPLPRPGSVADDLPSGGARDPAGSCGVGPVADAGERFDGEDDLDGKVEEGGDAQGEMQARAVLAAFEVADGLIVHAERVCELTSADTLLGPEQRDPVVDGLAHRTNWFAA